MDPDSGKIYRIEGENAPGNLIEILAEQMTAKQEAEMQVSPFDNRSELGKLFTGNRKERRQQAAIARRETRREARRGSLTPVVGDAASPPSVG